MQLSRVTICCLATLFSVGLLYAYPPYTEFGSEAVGSSTSGSVFIPISSDQLSAGPTYTFHYGIDFVAGTCTATTGGCNLAVTFTPTAPGSRADAVVVKDSNGTVLTKALVHGTGLGPLVEFNPGSTTRRFTPASGQSVSSMAVDLAGSVYFVLQSDALHERILKLDPGATTPQIVVPDTQIYGRIGLDGAGNLYYTDNNGVEEVDADTGATTLVTSLIAYSSSVGVQSALGAVDFAGNLYRLTSATVERYNPIGGSLVTIAGTTSGPSQGDGGPALSAVLANPVALAVDPAGNIYISELAGRIRKVDAGTHIITTIAGNGTYGYTGDGALSVNAQIGRCYLLTTDPVGNLYLGDETEYVVRKIDAATQIISTIAGSPGGWGAATGLLSNNVQVDFYDSNGIAVDSAGNLFATTFWDNGLFEFSFASPTLPFTAPGSANLPLTESIIDAGNEPLTLTSITASGSFTLQTASTNPCTTPLTLAQGTSCQTIIVYSGSGQTGGLTVTGNMPGSSTTATLSLQYPQITLETPANALLSPPLDFGTGVVGGSSIQSINLYNPTSATLYVQSVTFTGPNAAEFSISSGASNCSGTPVGPTSYCSLYIVFQPQSSGAHSATLVINSNAVSATTLALSGTAVLPGVLIPSLSQLAFTAPASGVFSAPQTITFTNTGAQSLTFVTPPFVSASWITTVSNSCAGLYQLDAGLSCTMTLQATAGNAPTGAAIYASYSNSLHGGIALNIPVTASLQTTPSALLFVPITPCRVVDTRTADGDLGGPKIAGRTYRTFNVPGSNCNIPSDAAAYSLNVTAVPDGLLGFMTVWPAGTTMPLASTLNSDGRVKANAAIIPAGTNGAVSVYASDPSHVILDINGYFTPAAANGLAFYPIRPCRIADTRLPSDTLAGPALGYGETRNFAILSSPCGLPSTAQAYSLNVTAVANNPIGYLTAWPTGNPLPLASTLNADAPDVTPNAAIVPAGTNGDVSVYTSNATDLVIDVNGYFAPPGPGGLLFYPSVPCRLIDTRVAASQQPFTGAFSVYVAAGVCGTPNAAQAYVFNATAVPTGALGFLTLWPGGETQPLVSTLNSSGQIVPNMAIVPAGNGTVNAYGSQETHLILDISGYFALPPPQ